MMFHLDYQFLVYTLVTVKSNLHKIWCEILLDHVYPLQTMANRKQSINISHFPLITILTLDGYKTLDPVEMLWFL